MIGKSIDHYRILEKIATGGMGEVYLAEDSKLGRQVALKFLPAGLDPDPSILERFQREARAAAALDHPNIVTVHEVGEFESRPYIVMSYVRGVPLSAKIRSQKLSVEQALRYAIQIAEALAHAHQSGVVHRDIKPDNILIDGEDRPRILDFGLAKLAGVTRLTREASTLGTIYYMSPEQARGEEVDERSDIYSLGVVLYEMLTGKVPFEGDQAATILNAIATQQPQPLARYQRDATDELERIVAKAMAKDRRERYASAADLLADLHRESRSSALGMTSVAAGSRTPTRAMPRALGAVAIVAVIAAIAIWRFGASDDSAPTLAGDTLAVMYFDNLVDPGDEKRVGEILTNLLITDLSEAEGLSVVSSQRLYDLLKLEGKEGVRSLDRETATAVARRAGARWMLLGSILQTEPSMIVTSQLVEVAGGRVSSSQRVSGNSGDNVFAVSELLLGELEQDLSLSTAPARILATSSEEAYRRYLEGVEAANRYFYDDARESLLSALEADSTLALAAYELAQGNVQLPEEARRRYIEQAVRHSAKLGERDRLLVRQLRAQLSGDVDRAMALREELFAKYPDDKNVLYRLSYRMRHEEPRRAIEYQLHCLEIDPLFKLSYNQLAYLYDRVGEFDRSIWAIDKYIELAPDEPNPYDSRGDLYANNGKIAEAIASYERALQVGPRFHPSLVKLGSMHEGVLDFARAEAAYRELMEVDSPIWRSTGRQALANLSARQGRFHEAIERARRGLAADELENLTGVAYWGKKVLLGFVHHMQGDEQAADAVFAELPRFHDGSADGWDGVMIELAARRGDAERARSLLEELESAPRALAETDEIELARGWADYAEGKLSEAVKHFQNAADYEPSVWAANWTCRTLLDMNRSAEAIHFLDRSLHRYDFSWTIDPVNSTEQLYFAGRAYEAAGQYDRAIELYQRFLRFWGDGDPGLPHVDDARERLERLAP